MNFLKFMNFYGVTAVDCAKIFNFSNSYVCRVNRGLESINKPLIQKACSELSIDYGKFFEPFDLFSNSHRMDVKKLLEDRKVVKERRDHQAAVAIALNIGPMKDIEKAVLVDRIAYENKTVHEIARENNYSINTIYRIERYIRKDIQSYIDDCYKDDPKWGENIHAR